jgi:transcriptional regulator GlxA family with amidase domain
MDPNLQFVGADLFSFQSVAAGPNRHRASMLGITDGVARRPLKNNIDFMDSQPDDPGRALVAKARRYLSSRLDQKVRLPEIAVALGVSATRLAQTFRIVEGVSLYRYALRLRLMRALEMLPQYDDLSRLALDAGFSNHSHFTTAFRQSFGYAPAVVRSQMRVRLGNAH